MNKTWEEKNAEEKARKFTFVLVAAAMVATSAMAAVVIWAAYNGKIPV